MTECGEEEEPMTLQTLHDYQKIHERVNDFLLERLEECNKAKFLYSHSGSDDYLLEFEFDESRNEINIKYSNIYGDTYWKSYDIPLDILFDNDFYDKIKDIVQKQREKEAILAVSYTHLTLPTNREV